MTGTQRSRLILNVPLAAALLADSWRAADESEETQRGATLSSPTTRGVEKRRTTYLNSASVQMLSGQ